MAHASDFALGSAFDLFRSETSGQLPAIVSSSEEQLPPFRHRVYGLTVATWIPFPELEPAPDDAPVDAVIRLGEVPADLTDAKFRGARFQTAPGRLLAWIPGAGRFLTSDGREIRLQPDPESTEADLRALLLCSPMGGLLHQRGILPLHASVIVSSQGAVAFMGVSGRGKSTLAAHFAARGFRVLADDVAAVTFDAAGRSVVQPGLPQFKLWPNSARELGKEVEALPRLRPQLEKRTLAFRESFCSEPVPLASLYVLTGDSRIPEPSLTLQPVLKRVTFLLENTYRAQYLPGLGIQKAHFQSLSRLAAQVPLTTITRPDRDGFSAATLVDLLAADLTP